MLFGAVDRFDGARRAEHRTLMFEDRINPFATRYVRPGAFEYLSSGGDRPDLLASRLEQQGWVGEIVGPHGAGKSALLIALIGELRRRGRAVLHVELHQGDRRLPPGTLAAPRRPWQLIAVDGAEQLGWWSWFQLRLFVRRRAWGLVVTSHRPLGLPLLASLNPDADLAWRIVQRLQADRPLITEAETLAAFHAHQGNLREMLFDLYDRYRARLEDCSRR